MPNLTREQRAKQGSQLPLGFNSRTATVSGAELRIKKRIALVTLRIEKLELEINERYLKLYDLSYKSYTKAKNSIDKCNTKLAKELATRSALIQQLHKLGVSYDGEAK